MNLRCLMLAALLSATTTCAAAGWPKLDSTAGSSLLRADQAFQMMPVERGPQGVKLEWVIAPGYFLYRDRIHVDSITSSGHQPIALKLPTAQPYNEAGEGIVQIYRNDVSGLLPLSVTAGLSRVRVRYQGCSDSGVCYPPQTQILDLKDSP